MNNNSSKNAPGLKFIILLFSLLGFLIIFYIYWYSYISKKSKYYLEEFSKNLINQNIEIYWDTVSTSGFPYRIENNISNIKVKIKDIEIQTNSLKLINQPWNLNHFLIKLENEIKFNYKTKKINVLNDKFIGSLIFKEYLNTLLSFQSNFLKFKSENFILKINQPELHVRDSYSKNIDDAITE